MTCIKQTNRADIRMCLRKGMSPYFGTSLILVGGRRGSTVGSRHGAKFDGLTKGYPTAFLPLIPVSLFPDFLFIPSYIGPIILILLLLRLMVILSCRG